MTDHQRYRKVERAGVKYWVEVEADYVWKSNGNLGRPKRARIVTTEGHREVLLGRIDAARREGRGVR